MDRMLVVVFDNEGKAYEAKKALLELDREGSITAYGYSVVTKKSDGTTTIKQGDDSGPLGTLTGTAVGSLIGLLGGPTGVVIGATAGLTGGAAVDLHNARIGDDFIDDVTKVLLPNTKLAEVLFKERVVDGLAGDIRAYLDTLERIAAFARSEPTVLLPSHDPLTEHCLVERITLTENEQGPLRRAASA